MQRWEYMRVASITDGAGKNQWTINGQTVKIPAFDEILSQMGNDGWELVGLTALFTTSPGGWEAKVSKDYIFKRPKS